MIHALRLSRPILALTRNALRPNPLLLNNHLSSSFSTDTTDTTDSKESSNSTIKRRSRKRNTIKSTEKNNASSANNIELFRPLNADGTEQSFDEYIASASLSPWVPTPEVVGRRALEIAKASTKDIHCDLGCGDGRMNFLAINYSYYVAKSIGIDNNADLIATATKRLSKIHPRPNITFLQEDLLSNEFMEDNEADGGNILGDCTVVTMNFVTEGLMKLKPILEKKLNRNCRVITIGYAMEGWELAWSEVMLDLPIHLYNVEEQEFARDYLTEGDNNNKDA